VPFLFTSDGRTIRYPDPIVKANDSIRLDITTGKIMDSIKFEAGNLCMVTGGRNTGRVGTIMHRERHPGSFDIVHVKVHIFLREIADLQLKLWWLNGNFVSIIMFKSKTLYDN
jgi:ribosomal protein S4E